MKAKIKSQSTVRTGALIACLMLAMAIRGDATTLTYEGFDVLPGEIDNASGETSFGWKSLVISPDFTIDFTWWGWDQFNNDFFHAVSDGGLTYEGLPSIGNAFEFTEEVPSTDGSFNHVYRDLSKFYSYSSSGQLWFSTIVQPKITGDPTGYGWFQVCLSAATNPGNEVYLGLSNADDQTVWSGGGERLYKDGINGEKWAYSEVPVEDGITAFLVMHLDFDNKTAAFYVNPPVDAADPGEPVAEFVMLTDMYVDKVRMRIFNNGPSIGEVGADYIGTLVDEIRLGDTYASVAADADLTDPGGGEVDTDPPVITGPSGEPGDATAVANVNENTVRVGTMEADEAVVWSVSGGDDGSLFTIGGATGGLSFKDFPDFENPIDLNTDNAYQVQVTATDEAGNPSTQDITVTILDVTDETPPLITGLSGAPGDAETTATIEEESTVVGIYTSDDEAATWDLSGGIDRDFFLIGAETGELSFAVAPDFGAPADLDGDNVYEVEVRATDVIGNAAVQLVYVTVLEKQESVTWAYWEPDALGWIDSDQGGGKFMGWINVTFDPWIWNLALSKYFYLPSGYVSEFGAWSYAPAYLDVAAPGEWGYWNPDSIGWADTTVGFLGWVNVYDKPFVFCDAISNYTYISEDGITESGSWLYIFLSLP